MKKSNIFQLNICGKVSECDKIDNDEAAICDSEKSIGRTNTELSFSDGGFLTLVYSGAQGKFKQTQNELVSY